MLTQKQEKFVQGLISGMSQREAYRAAYDCKRATDKSVDELASRLMANVKVKSRYEELRKASEIKAVEDATSIRAEIITQLTKMLRSDISDYFSFEPMGEGEECIPKLKDLSKAETTAVRSIGVDRYGKTKIELYDKLPVMQKLCDLLGITAEQGEPLRIEISAPKDYLT